MSVPNFSVWLARTCVMFAVNCRFVRVVPLRRVVAERLIAGDLDSRQRARAAARAARPRLVGRGALLVQIGRQPDVGRSHRRQRLPIASLVKRVRAHLRIDDRRGALHPRPVSGPRVRRPLHVLGMDPDALVRPVVEPFGEVAAAPPAEEPVRVRVVVIEARAVDLALDRIGIGPHEIVVRRLLPRIDRVVVRLRQETSRSAGTSG